MVSTAAASAIGGHVESVRASFWQRVSALMVDAAIIAAVLTLIEVTLSKLSGGRPADPIDDYSFVLYGLYFMLLEWLFGGTLAQRFFCMRVRSVSGGSASLVQIIKRFTVRFGWLLIIPAAQHLAYMLPDRMIEILVGLSALNLAIILAIVINASKTMRKGELAWHDRWAQTEVICT